MDGKVTTELLSPTKNLPPKTGSCKRANKLSPKPFFAECILNG